VIREIFPSLVLIRPDAAPERTSFTYFLRREGGSVLFATKQDVSSYTAQLKELGGVQHILLGDRHHALPATAAFARRLGTVLSASETEAKVLASGGITIGQKIESKRGLYAPDLEIIPTPGHTRGALSYLWSNAGKRYLFIGDTLVPIGDAWQYWVSRPSLTTMRRTVELLATVQFDVILSNSFAATPRPWIEVDTASRKRLFAKLAAQLADSTRLNRSGLPHT
jgi:hypothetical protein